MLFWVKEFWWLFEVRNKDEWLLSENIIGEVEILMDVFLLCLYFTFCRVEMRILSLKLDNALGQVKYSEGWGEP